MSGMNSQVAGNFGTALFEAARDRNAVAQLLEESMALHKAMAEVPGFLDFLIAPDVNHEDKERLADRVLGTRFHELLRNFVLLMLRKRRIALLDDALDSFRAAAEEEMGLRRGKVTSATPLTNWEKDRLQSALQEYMGKTLTIDYRVDPKVLGGVVFKSGDLLIDNSLQTQLRELGEQLMSVRM